MNDYYKILGVSQQASDQDIKRAYRRLAHQYHPDKGGDAQKFQEISEAYQVLSDKEKRAQYDRFGKTFEGGVPGGFSGFRWGWGRPGQEGDDEESFGFDFQDIGDLFEDFFGGGTHPKNKKQGGDIEMELGIPLEATLAPAQEGILLTKYLMCTRCQGVGAEPNTKVKECFACRGTGEVQEIRKSVFGSFTKMSMCPECGGEGLKPEHLCNVCKGEGRVQGEEEFKVSVPAGVDSHQILKLKEKGDAGRRKGPSGDLYVRIFVKPHKLFQRKGDNISIKVPVLFSQVALGEEIEVPTLDGQSMKMSILAGSKSGDVLKVPGKGIPHFRGLGRGDMFVELEIQTPKKLTKEQRDLLEELRKFGL